MSNHKKTFLGSMLAFFLGTSCCWLSSLAIWIGGVTLLGKVAIYIENIQFLFLGAGLLLMVISIIFYQQKTKSK